MGFEILSQGYEDCLVHYYSDNNQIYITNITLYERHIETMIIPEKIKGKRVVGIYLKAFPKPVLEYGNYQVIIPNTVDIILPIRGNTPLPSFISAFFFAKVQYKDLGRDNEIDITMRCLINAISMERYGYTTKKTAEEYVMIPAQYIIFSYWERPRNGIWEYGDCLFSCHVNRKDITINSRKIASYTFVNELYTSITFESPWVEIDSSAISNCPVLEEIIFPEHFIAYQGPVVEECINLRKLVVLSNTPIEKKSLIRKCPKANIVLR